MNKMIIYGIIIILLTISGMVYWFFQTIPNQSAIDAQIIDIKPINTNLLTSSVISSLKNLDKNGEIPVTIQGKNLGKTNPF